VSGFDLEEARRRLEGEGAVVEDMKGELGPWLHATLNLGPATVVAVAVFPSGYASASASASAEDFGVASACAAAMLREVAMAKVAAPAEATP
jgi:hypothetical protein